MPSLTETLRQQREGKLKRGPGGSLTQETPEEVQSLAATAGLQAPPTTAIGTAAIGGTDKQQDMAGSKAQKESALSLATAPVEQGLAATVRRAQSRTEMTGQEQGQKQKSQDMMNLGALGDRVVGFIDAQKQKLQTQAQAATQQNTLQVNTADQFQGKDVSSIKSKLEQFRREPNNQQLLLEINQALGYDINTQLSPAQVNELYESATDTIARGAAGNVDDDLTVQDLVAQGDLGYTPTELSQLLGVPESTLTGMTVGQLRSEIERVGQQEFATTQELQQKAQSGQLGIAERGIAQQAAREASTTGVRATEADYNNIESQIQNADRVMFGGKEYQVDELLQDETISNIIKDYFESAPDSELRKQIDASEPALKEFIQKNQAVLQEASGAMQAGATEFRETQEFNKGLTNIAGQSLDPSIASKLIPGFGTLQAQRVDTASIPFFQALEAMPSENRKAQAVNALNAAQDTYPDVADQLSQLNAEQIQNLNIGKAGSYFEKWLGNRQLRDRVSAIPANDTNSLIQEAFANVTPEGFREAQKTARQLSAFGLDTGLGVDISDTSRLKDQILQATPQVGLSDASSGNIPTYQKKELGRIQYPKDPIQATLVEWASPYSADGTLDADEVRAVAGRVSQTTPDGLKWLMTMEDMAHRPNAKIDRNAITQERFKLTNANTEREWGNILNNDIPPTEVVSRLSALTKQDSRIINPEHTQNKIAEYVTNVAGSRDVFFTDALKAIETAVREGGPRVAKALVHSPAVTARVQEYAKANAEGNAPGKSANDPQYKMHYNEALKHYASLIDMNTVPLR